jgi:hypothetical protein
VFELADLDEDKFDIDNFGKPPPIPEPIEIVVPIVTDFTEGQQAKLEDYVCSKIEAMK